MKTLLPMGSKILLAITGVLCVIGCTNHSKKSKASAEVVVTQVASAPAPTVIIATNMPVNPPVAATTVVTVAPTNIVAVQTMALTNAQPTEIIPPKPLVTSPGLAEIIRLYQSKVEESVILSFIEASNNPYKPTADEIIYMNDLGMSSKIIVALIQKGDKVREEEAQKIMETALASQGTGTMPSTVSVAPQNVTTAVDPNAPPPTVTTTTVDPNQPVAVASQPAVTYVQPATTYVEQPSVNYVQAQSYVEPQTANVGYFYDSLAPYGSWMHMPGYGWVWQPSVVAVNPSWQPYYDNGRWLYTDSGWYWHSSYSWGWAPFHYGRWFRHAHRGWIWCPDTNWGPSWVSWRYSPGYCGWAPLPPGAGFTVGRGWSYHGSYVGSDCDFGLTYLSFSFVSYDHFYSDRWHRYGIRGGHGQHIYRDSKLSNHYFVGPDKRIINEGIPRDHFAKISRTEISKITIKDTPSDGPRSTRPERFDDRSKSLTVYRPEMAKSPPPRPTINASASATPTANTRVPVSATDADVSKRPAASRSEVSKTVPTTPPASSDLAGPPNNAASGNNRRGEGKAPRPQAVTQTPTSNPSPAVSSPLAVSPAGGNSRSEVPKTLPPTQNPTSSRASAAITAPKAVPQTMRPSTSPTVQPQISGTPSTGLTSSSGAMGNRSTPVPNSPTRITTITPRSEVSKQQNLRPTPAVTTPAVTTSTVITRNGQTYTTPVQSSPTITPPAARYTGSGRQEVSKSPNTAPMMVSPQASPSTTISRPAPISSVPSGNNPISSSPRPMTINPYGSSGNRPISSAPPVAVPSRSVGGPVISTQPSPSIGSRGFEPAPSRAISVPTTRSAPSISVQPSMAPSMQRSAPVSAPAPVRSSPPPSISAQPSISRPAPAAATSTSGSDPNRNRRNP